MVLSESCSITAPSVTMANYDKKTIQNITHSHYLMLSRFLLIFALSLCYSKTLAVIMHPNAYIRDTPVLCDYILRHQVVLCAEGAFEVITTERPRWTLSPQYAYLLDGVSNIAILAPHASYCHGGVCGASMEMFEELSRKYAFGGLNAHLCRLVVIASNVASAHTGAHTPL